MQTLRGSESEFAEVHKADPIYTNHNQTNQSYTDISYTNPINQSGGTDEMEYNISRIKEERSAYAQIVRDNTDYEFLIEQNPGKADTINELIIIMVEPESSKLLPDNYAEVIYLLHSNKITAVEAMKRLGMKKTTFYKLARRLMNAFSSYFGA